MRKFLTTLLFIFAVAIVFNACDDKKASESKDASESVNSDSTGLAGDVTSTNEDAVVLSGDVTGS